MKFAKKLQEELEQGWNGQSLGSLGMDGIEKGIFFRIL
jgi:hypothetical protein